MADRTTPLDPDSAKGKQVAYDLTLLLEELEENIARREQDAGDVDEPGRAA